MGLFGNRTRTETVADRLLALGSRNASDRGTLADDARTRSRRREIQLIINIIEPDPAWQPWLITDEAALGDLLGNDENEMRGRLDFDFGLELAVDLGQPDWRVVDEIKKRLPDWPTDD
jgi:hypothetical protein